MKTKITIFAFLLFGGLLLSTSCEKAVDKLLEKITPDLSTEIDGTVWKTHNVLAFDTDSGFTVTAAEDSTYFAFAINEFKNGKYPINNINVATYTFGESFNIFVASEGEIEVSEAEDNGGNFNMKFHFKAFNIAGDSVMITNGVAKNIINPL
ncbi:MAG: hypothetical protein KAG64_04785 [Bacteroidales bacterium]|nr:hypothetical protein [Bacteroidales bacterium]